MGGSSRNKLVIREARRSDAPSIFKIHLESLNWLDPEDYEWFTALLSVRSRRRRILVAEYDGRVVGFVIAYRYRGKAYIDSIAVDRDYRGLGIGGRLLSHIEDLLRNEGVKLVSLSVRRDNDAALGFYLKKGYIIRGVVLLLSAYTDRIKTVNSNGYHVLVKIVDEYDDWRKKFLSSTWWSSLTEPVDKIIYARHYREEYVLEIFRNGKLRGIAEYSPDKHTVIDYLAVSYNKPIESLSVLLSALRDEALKNRTEKITIPVDASKTMLVKKILEHGYIVENTEYRLVKHLV